VVVQNLFPPYEQYSFEASLSSFNNDSKAPFFGCLASVTMDPFGFKVLVPVEQWVAQRPQITKFRPGHDARILVSPDQDNATSIDVVLEFNVPMDCDGVTSSVSVNVSSSGRTAAGGQVEVTNAQCGSVTSPEGPSMIGADVSAWSWNATLVNVPDGVVTLTVSNAPSAGGNTTTNVCPSFKQVNL
jgi:alpha-1,3-glucan synthase